MLTNLTDFALLFSIVPVNLDVGIGGCVEWFHWWHRRLDMLNVIAVSSDKGFFLLHKILSSISPFLISSVEGEREKQRKRISNLHVSSSPV